MDGMFPNFEKIGRSLFIIGCLIIIFSFSIGLFIGKGCTVKHKHKINLLNEK